MEADIDRIAKFLLEKGCDSPFSLTFHGMDQLFNPSLFYASSTERLLAFPLSPTRFQLSALEFYQELQEDGLNCERLRTHFAALSSRLASEPSTASPSTVVINNYEEVIKQKDEQIALLEYELRVAKEDVVSQQMELRRMQTLLTAVYGVSLSLVLIPYCCVCV